MFSQLNCPFYWGSLTYIFTIFNKEFCEWLKIDYIVYKGTYNEQ